MNTTEKSKIQRSLLSYRNILYIISCIDLVILIIIIIMLIIYYENTLAWGYLIFFVIFTPIHRSIAIIRSNLERSSNTDISKLKFILNVNGIMDINCIIMFLIGFLVILMGNVKPVWWTIFLCVIFAGTLLVVILWFYGIVFFHPNFLPIRNVNYYDILGLRWRKPTGQQITSFVNRLVLTVPESEPEIVKFSEFRSEKFGNADKCPICLDYYDNYYDNDDLLKLDCHHLFHRYCIKSWVKHKESCPICRKSILVIQI